MNPDIEMIAQFMGFDGQHEEWCGNNILVDDMFSETGKSMISYDPDKNWSQLMPVIEKIKVKAVQKATTDEFYCRSLTVLDSKVTISIEILYNRVVEFVKWASASESDSKI